MPLLAVTLYAEEYRGPFRMYWSSPVSFGWFFQRKWEYEYGRDWAMQICQEWYDYDGRRENFIMELEPKGMRTAEVRRLTSPIRFKFPVLAHWIKR